MRSGTGMFFASALLALLPSLAHRINSSPIGYGVLLGGFGAGAVLGAVLLQSARERWSANLIVSAGIAGFGLVTMAAGELHAIWLLGAVMVVGGSAWVSFLSLL
ncbi:MAG TPA: MFS transporter, partial [Candidatus Sulfotelmatobacter sp.]